MSLENKAKTYSELFLLHDDHQITLSSKWVRLEDAHQVENRKNALELICSGLEGQLGLAEERLERIRSLIKDYPQLNELKGTSSERFDQLFMHTKKVAQWLERLKEASGNTIR